LLGQQPSGGANRRIGRSPVARAGNYTGGSVAVRARSGRAAAGLVFPSAHGQRAQPAATGRHAHQIVLDPAERFALVADLGTDRILVFRYDALAAPSAERAAGGRSGSGRRTAPPGVAPERPASMRSPGWRRQ
jgi:6-phosphogluconolactonase